MYLLGKYTEQKTKQPNSKKLPHDNTISFPCSHGSGEPGKVE